MVDVCASYEVLLRKREKLRKRIHDVETELARLKKLRYMLKSELRQVEKRIAELETMCGEGDDSTQQHD